MNSPTVSMNIGIETHVTLLTDSKLFCSCKQAFAARPNSLCCPICLGLPGALPSLNKRAVYLCVLAGILTNCNIDKYCILSRKHYYYPDNPKGYQITQDSHPLCKDGFLTINDKHNHIKKIPINRIHIEQDAGKMIHKNNKTLIDYNRSGIPLIEIVTPPIFDNPEDVINYLKSLRQMLIYAQITEGKMNEGDFRCDINISLQFPDDNKPSPRVEIKNLNSFQSIFDCIIFEYSRQLSLYKNKITISSQTRRYDQKNKTTHPLRHKQEEGYFYIKDPDFPQIELPENLVSSMKSSLPKSPRQRLFDYINNFSLEPSQAKLLTEDKHLGDYFDQIAALSSKFSLIANLLLNDVTKLGSVKKQENSFVINPKNFAILVKLIANNDISITTGKTILKSLWKKDQDPINFIDHHSLWQISDKEKIETIVCQLLDKNKDLVLSFKDGKKSVFNALVGKAMADSKGKLNPNILSNILKDKLENL